MQKDGIQQILFSSQTDGSFHFWWRLYCRESCAGAVPTCWKQRNQIGALLERCLCGDEAAWNQLVDKYGALVHTMARRYQSSQADAEAVMLRVFESLLKSLPGLRREQSLVVWLVRTTEREAQRLGEAADSHPGQQQLE